MSHWNLFFVFLQSVLLSYSGWGSVAIVRDAVVLQHGLISDSQLTAFLALSQVTPGPLGFYLLYVGYSVSGIVGAAVAWAALSLSALLILPIVRLLERGRDVRWLKGATTGVVVASAALMFSTAGDLSRHVLTSWPLAAISLVSLGALLSSRVPSVVVIGIAATVGAIVGR